MAHEDLFTHSSVTLCTDGKYGIPSLVCVCAQWQAACLSHMGCRVTPPSADWCSCVQEDRLGTAPDCVVTMADTVLPVYLCVVYGGL